jgi:hypothetical protein
VSLDADIRAALRAGDLKTLFLELLGWDQPGIPPFTVEVEKTLVSVAAVAQKRGLHVLEIAAEHVPSADLQHLIDVEISQRAPERLLVFTDPAEQVWRWPEPRKSGGVRLVPHQSSRTSPSEALVQRLAGVRFAFAEEATVTLPVVKDRVRAQFNAEQVTARFYNQFESHHEQLQLGLEGIPDGTLARWYASLLMNRLMFIYFLQRKGFINGDRDYLRSCLTAIRDLRGRDQFYSFYREMLLPMFHHGFGSHRHQYEDSKIASILGDVPYVNGGIFDEHELESEYEISIPDQEFERIFDFFDEFTWHLDDRPHGDPNAINPDVIGYIFERYINLTSSGKKKDGAYYTKEDVTGYMVASSLIPRLLDRLVESCGADLGHHLGAVPRRYIPEALRYGQTEDGGWLSTSEGVAEAWADPAQWIELAGIAHDPASQISDESWIETLDRRDEVERLIALLESGEVTGLDQLVTLNLDSRTLLGDVIHRLSTAKEVATAWDEVTATTVMDPTCGSGAFLFAALDVLDDVYAALLERARTLLAVGGGDAERLLTPIVAAADAHPNDAYYRRKHAALNNLYGVDIMHEAVETAKLRLFLALASTLEDRHEIEPLPDLDFNLRAGNLLVGFRDADDARARVGTVDLTALVAVDEFLPKAERVAERRTAFVGAQANGDPSGVIDAKRELSAALEDVALAADEAYATAQGVAADATADYHAWYLDSQPFHWFLEFPHIMADGGFDVVVGNPPYISTSEIRYTIDGFKTSGLRDIYAPCVERSLGLLSSKGRFAMILPISFQFSSRFALAREVVLGRGTVWLSTFSRNPSPLFTAGLGVRNTIVVVSPIGDGTYTTETRRWQLEAREALFQTQRYSSLDPKARRSGWLPRTGDGGVAALLLELRDRGEALRTSVVRSSAFSVGFKAFALYYLSVYIETPPVYNRDGDLIPPPADKTIYFATEEDQLLAFALLAGEISTMWWMSTGDDFNVTGGSLMELPISLKAVDSIRDELLDKARALNTLATNPDVLLFTPYAGLMTGSWDLRRLRRATREIDQLVLRSLGLERYWPAVLRANARFSKSTGERPGTKRGTAWRQERGAVASP